MSLPKHISAVIITLNEESNIGDCIRSLDGVCDEVIVVDSSSEDRTCMIASDLGAKIFIREPQNGNAYGDQKNFGATQTNNEWILSIDADERLDETLKKAIQEVKLDNNIVYALNVKTNYLGKWIKHCGWYPNYKKRLYNKKHIKWDGELVHESLISIAPYKISKLKGDLLHYSYPSLEKHHEKTERYASLTAQNWKRKNIEPSVLKRIFGPAFRFVRTYILKLGILDGKEGYMISKMSALLVRRQLYYFDKIRTEQ